MTTQRNQRSVDVVSFPSTQHKVNVYTYRNGNVFVKSECTLECLERGYAELIQYVLNLITINKDLDYSLRSMNDELVVVTHPRNAVGNEKFLSEEIVLTLTKAQIDAVRKIVTKTIADFMNIFTIYQQNSNKTLTKEKEDENHIQTSRLLRMTERSRILCLEDLLHIYLLVRGSTYFDIVCYLLTAASFTIPSVLTVTHLFYQNARRLEGSDLHQHARKLTAEKDNISRGEIRIMTGLVVRYRTLIRLRVQQTRPSIQIYSSFDLVCDDDQPSTSSAANVKIQQKEEVLTLGKLSWKKKQSEVLNEIIECIDSIPALRNLARSSINSSGFDSRHFIFEICSTSAVSRILHNKVAPHLVEENVNEMRNRIAKHEGLGDLPFIQHLASVFALAEEVEGDPSENFAPMTFTTEYDIISGVKSISDFILSQVLSMN